MAKDIRLAMMKGKIHRATVTKADLHYEGSITVDTALLKAAGILNHEMVDVLNITNGQRITTYTIPGKAGEIQINGAAAHLFKRGHKVIIVAYCYMSEAMAKNHKPKVMLVDGKNKPVKKK
jgi:aspartate 1-decarboxylase